MPLTHAEAKTRLERITSSALDPILTSAELDDLLMQFEIPDLDNIAPDWAERWVINGVYAVGDAVRPTIPNSHYYRVTASDGLAGAVEPVWPLIALGSVSADGVTYQEAGLGYQGAWNLSAAAAEGWRWKAGKAAGRFDFGSDVHNFHRSQIHKQCLEMAAYYERGALGTIVLTEDLGPVPVIGNLNGGA